MTFPGDSLQRSGRHDAAERFELCTEGWAQMVEKIRTKY
jgi:hypothetical protein